MHNKIIICLLMLTATVLVQCTKESTPPPSNETCQSFSDNTYVSNIKAILDANCATSGCHDAQSATEGIILADYANAVDAANSRDIVCSITGGSGCTPMPLGSATLTSEEIDRIQCWIEANTPEQ